MPVKRFLSGALSIGAVIAMALAGVILGISLYVAIRGTSNWVSISGIVIGGIIILTSAFLLIGAAAKSRGCLCLYIVLIIPLAIVEVVLGILAVVRSDAVSTSIAKSLGNTDVDSWIISNIKAVGIMILVAAGLHVASLLLVWWLSHEIRRSRIRDRLQEDSLPTVRQPRRTNEVVEHIRAKYSSTPANPFGSKATPPSTNPYIDVP